MPPVGPVAPRLENSGMDLSLPGAVMNLEPVQRYQSDSLQPHRLPHCCRCQSRQPAEFNVAGKGSGGSNHPGLDLHFRSLAVQHAESGLQLSGAPGDIFDNQGIAAFVSHNVSTGRKKLLDDRHCVPGMSIAQIAGDGLLGHCQRLRFLLGAPRLGSVFMVSSVAMRRTLPCSVQASPLLSSTMARAWSQGTSSRTMVTEPFTEGSSTTFRPLIR